MSCTMLLLLVHIIFLVIWPAAAVWPKPRSMTTGNSTLWLDKSAVSLDYECEGNLSFGGSFLNRRYISESAFEYHVNRTVDLSEYSIIHETVARKIYSVGTTKFVPWKFYTRGSNFEPEINQDPQMLKTIKIVQTTCPAREKLDPTSYFAGDESYKISVSGDTATITANSTLGTLRAIETFKQLFYAHSQSHFKYAANIPIQIEDAPHWSHRGLSLDISRNAYAPADVIRTIDAMESVKFSRLHLHATDCQSWPLEIPALPELASKGAYQPWLVWSVADLAMVQAHGAKKGVAVYIETDMPGHTAAIHFAYPDLIAAFNQTDWQTFAAEPESGQLKLNSSAVTDFIDQLFADLMPRVNQYSPIYHVGGDEFNKNVYLLDETVKSNDSQVIQPLLARFMDNVLRHVENNNMRPMVWEEQILEWNLTLPRSGNSSTLVQVWQDATHVSSVLNKGYPVIFGDYSHWYLDCGYGGFINPYPSGVSPPGVPYNTSGGQPTVIADPFLDYCNPLKNWRHVYVYNPYINVTQDLWHLIEGGEVLLWSELTDPANLDGKLWPRAASAAEVLWAGPRNASMIEEASRRLGEWRERAVIDMRIASAPVQMTWCLMEGGCEL